MLEMTQSLSGEGVKIPLRVQRGTSPGPVVFVSGAVHGDELNGTGIVRELMINQPLQILAGTLILVPVVNMLGFERQSRYLPDRRDLNRCFPGNSSGNISSRFAHRLFSEIVTKCDFGIDLHSAAVRRTNFPNVRANLKDAKVARLAKAFGCELIVNGKGPVGSLRRSASEAGCPTIILEAGEVWKIEPTVVDYGVRGVRNVLSWLGMINDKPIRPAYQSLIDKTNWVRAESGGMLEFHVGPGDLVEEGQALATNTNLQGEELGVIKSPQDGVVLGMSTLPAVTPGQPVVHLAIPKNGIAPIREALDRLPEESIQHRMREDLATNLVVSEFDDEV